MSGWLRIFDYDGLAYPAMLWLGVIVLALFVAESLGLAPGAIRVSTGELLARISGRRPDAARRIPAVLRGLGLFLLLMALACPMRGYHIRKDRAGVIDIMLCLDVSGSMQQQDFTINGKPHDRLYVAREAARSFINNRRETRDTRFGLDRIGLVLFSGLAWTQCPLTLDYDILERELDNSTIAAERKQGTAIGSALGLAVRRLSKSEAKSKVVVLLSDGVNNRGDLDPITAARLAKEYGIRVYTIGAGSTEEVTVRRGLFPVRTEAIDAETMRQMAEITGGRFYLATDTESLLRAYDEIGALEVTEIDVGDYYEAREEFMPYLLAGAAALVASVFSRRLWFEVMP
ncbi:MAG TPA: VWA domain-containing protein [Candidatus Hydrogenedentes bacterium]|nr:VWA domain-containing protein [Candidatus Hydrogenedentota bacterium]